MARVTALVAANVHHNSVFFDPAFWTVLVWFEGDSVTGRSCMAIGERDVGDARAAVAAIAVIGVGVNFVRVHAVRPSA